MTDLIKLKNENDRRWKEAKITRSGFNSIAKKVIANKSRYQDIVKRCRDLGSMMNDSSWKFVAVIHVRESDMDFTTHLGQGDPLDRKTVHVPAGRGPFFGPDAFERGAVDALVDCPPRAAMTNKDWSISGMLTYLEQYNGLAYANAGTPSPYIWAGTDQYVSGKVVVDHGPIMWDVVDKQLGCAGMLLAIQAEDRKAGRGVAAGTVVVAGGVAAQQANAAGQSLAIILGVAFAVIVIAVAVFVVWPQFSKKD